ncbi:PREDICTED: uncharacterized protein LOC106816401 [Priapulus caudatus]|uniref:Uncharacterized protein LOC106816401 n=1 Tax=Priapulus caudatus TaxID=37621 RepID=A0ABM1EWB6_PRICU|nr:PREDICTED: uncharacterized protein LOC106816401 [Priapulus caudatus]
MELTTLPGDHVEEEVTVVDLDVGTLNSGKTFRLTDVISREKLNVSLDNGVTSSDIRHMLHLRDVTLVNVDVYQVDLIIGSDHAHLLIDVETRSGKEGEPIATRTPLGWAMFGPTKKFKPKKASTYFANSTLSLEKQVERFWKLDDPLYKEETDLSVSDSKVISQWESSIRREGPHYSLWIPFKQRPPQMLNNYSMAKHRLDLLGKRLSKDSELREKYVQGIQDSVEKGHAEEVPREQLALDHRKEAIWYLPHHPVIHPRKPGKVRVVYDCSAPYQGVLLNVLIRQGPDLMNKLIAVMLRFRQGTYSIYVRYRGNVYAGEGAPRGPGLSTFPLVGGRRHHQTIQDLQNDFDVKTVQTVDKNFYVDDCLKSVVSKEEAMRLIKQLCELLSLRGFGLTKFISNSRRVMMSLPQTEWVKREPSVCCGE